MGDRDDRPRRRSRSRSRDRGKKRRSKEASRRRRSRSRSRSESSDEEATKAARAAKLVREVERGRAAAAFDGAAPRAAEASRRAARDAGRSPGPTPPPFPFLLQADKVSRHLKKHAASAAAAAGYNDADNRFGDANLGSRFVWGKKIEASLRAGADAADLTAAAEARRQLERLDEIEKVKQRRDAREAEREEKERAFEASAREKAAAEGAALEAKEEAFHLEQAKERAASRVRSGRATQADVFAKELHLLGPPWSLAPEPRPPHTALPDLAADELADLVDDVRGWAELDTAPRSAGWWAAAGTLSRAALARAEARAADAGPAAAATGLHPAVAADVEALLEGKSVAELEALEAGARAAAEDPDAGDPDYWAATLRALEPAKAAAWLADAHASLVEAAPVVVEGGRVEAAAPAAAATAPSSSAPPPDDLSDGRFSPPPATEDEIATALAAGAEEVDADEDVRILASLRARARYAAARSLPAPGAAPPRDDDPDVVYEQLVRAGGGAAVRDADFDAGTAALRAAAAACMGDAEGDAPLTGDATADSEARVYWWHDRYRAR